MHNPYGVQDPHGAPGAARHPSGVAPSPYQPGVPGPVPGRRLSRGALLGIIAGAVVIVVILVTAIGIGVTAAIRPAPTESKSAADPEGIVKDYFTALQDGDAEQALSYLDESRTDKSLLNDEVLKASAKISKISKVSLKTSEEDDSTASVQAKFSIGSKRVTQDFTVYKEYQGGYSILTGGTITLTPSALDGVPVTVNGQETTGDTWRVFPGAYEIALAEGLDGFSISGGDDLVVAGDGFDAFDGVELALNDTGVQQFRDAVTDAVNTCIASTTLAAGCGIDLPGTLSDGTVVQDGTITRSLSADAQAKLANLEPETSYVDPRIFRGDAIGSVNVSSTNCTIGGAVGPCTIEFGPMLGSPQVDFTSGTPVVRWD